MCDILSSYVFVDGMKMHAYHGVLPQERLTGNDYTVSVRAGYDVRLATESDDVADTLNYAAIYEVVRCEMGVSSQLVEHVAARIGKSLFRRFPDISSLDITIVKHNPPMGADCSGAGVELHLINHKTI